MLDVKICIEPATQAAEESRLLVTDEERRTAGTFGTRRRRNEYLLWRHIVRRELGADVEIGYSAAGRPVLKNRDINIGVSHSQELVTVVISPRRCAIDTEPLTRDFSKAAARYISESESRLSDDPRLPAALWCAKETLYKYSGKSGLDLLNDIRIRKVDFGRKIIAGAICGGDVAELRMLEYKGSLVVYIG